MQAHEYDPLPATTVQTYTESLLSMEKEGLITPQERDSILERLRRRRGDKLPWWWARDRAGGVYQFELYLSRGVPNGITACLAWLDNDTAARREE